MTECDGAVGGPADGWVIVAMPDPAAAATALAKLKSKRSCKFGATLQLIEQGGSGEGEEEAGGEEKMEEQESAPAPAAEAAGEEGTGLLAGAAAAGLAQFTATNRNHSTS